MSATVFLPQPDVDSALIELRPRSLETLPFFHEQTFRELVIRGFSQRRKQLQKLLRSAVPDWATASTSVGFPPQARAEELSVEQWIALSNLVEPMQGAESPNVASERFPVVDEDDRVVREAPRSEVHGNNLRHRAVHIFIFNDRGERFPAKAFALERPASTVVGFKRGRSC